MSTTCDVCGNDYDGAFTVSRNGEQHVFDSFECAMHLMAPRCAHCGCMVMGHGVQAGESVFCCAHCARHEGASEIRDRV
jgi:hypothetical protein